MLNMIFLLPTTTGIVDGASVVNGVSVVGGAAEDKQLKVDGIY